MAFDTAAGYANLPSGNFTPSIFSQKVLTSEQDKATAKFPCLERFLTPQLAQVLT